MALRIRIVLATAVIVLVLVTCLYSISSNVIVGGFNRVERQETLTNVGRAVDALSAELGYLKDKSGDWANWDEAYEFMEDENPEFVSSNLTDLAYPDMRVSLILFVRKAGTVVAGGSYDLENNRAVRIPQFFEHFSASDPILQPVASNEIRTGTLLLNERPMLVAIRPILTSDHQGPPHGTLILGRYVDNSLADELSNSVHASITLARWGDRQLPADFQMARDSLSTVGQVLINPLDEQNMASYVVLADLYDKPGLILRLVTDRPVHEQSQTTMQYLLGALIIVGLVCGACAIVLLDRLTGAWEARRVSEERYSLAVRGSNDGIWDWDLKTGQVHYSARCKAILGYQEDEISTSIDEWLTRIHPDDKERVDAEIADHLKGISADIHSEHRLQHRGGDYVWVLCRGLAVRDQSGKVVRMAGSLADITVRKRAEEQLLHHAFYDALTGLPNRALFLDRLGHAIERGRRLAGHKYAVIYMDLDRFKIVNDSFGHPLGDQLLKSCSHRILLSVRSMDTVARLGGDEFVILVEDIDGLHAVKNLADRLLAELALPFDLAGHTIFTSASLGIVMGSIDYELPDNVLRDADIALYRAKAHGRAQYQIFDAVMRENANASLELENDLRSAVDRGEFQLYYQPIVSVADKQITGFEALIRWNHPVRGLIPPADFIPLAEETGVILPLGEWVLGEACRQLRQWRDAYPATSSLAVSVNMSTKQFAQPDLPSIVGRALAHNGLTPESLRLEITESVIMEDPAVGADILARLREMGVEVQIDDFGTGYSSLSYLQQFPINTLKIDRSFVNQMGKVTGANGESNGTEIVQTIISLARQLGLKVVAEGVETAEQLGWLKDLDCQFIQGYFVSKPLPSNKVSELITANGLVWPTEKTSSRAVRQRATAEV